MKKLALVVLVALPTFALALTSAPTEKIDFLAKNGTVSFDHTRHIDANVSCDTCHHNGVDTGGCRSCHREEGGAPEFKKAAHDLCKTCHKESGVNTSCKTCHVK